MNDKEQKGLDMRNKFASNNLQACLDNEDLLDDWEKEFIINMQGIKNAAGTLAILSQKQFNKLKEISTKVKSKGN